jgi:acyl carrier protein
MAAYNLARSAQTLSGDIPARLHGVIAEHLSIDPTLLRDEAHFLNDLGLDWLDLLELITFIETEFAVEFADDEIDRLHLVGDLIRFVQKHGQQ